MSTQNKIKDILRGHLFTDGDWIESKDQDPKGTIRLIQLADIGDGQFIDKSSRYINEATAKRLRCTFLQKNDVLVARMPDPLGRACVFPLDGQEKYITAVDVCILRPGKNCDPNYLKYALNSTKTRQEIEQQSTGTTRKRISRKKLGELQIPLPPLPIQKKIAAILDAADAYRQKTKALIEKYDQLTQSLFLEIFGDPVRNERGWETRPIKLIGKVITGNTPPRNNKSNYGDFIEWIKTDNINTPNQYITKADEYLSESGLSKGRFANAGSILVTCIAGSRRVLGNAAITDRKVAFNQQINAFSPKSGNLKFWYYHFKLAQKYVQSFSTGGMKGMISKGNFEKMEFICPPNSLQNKFGTQITSVDSQIEKIFSTLNKAEELFHSLLQRAFKGELIV